ncbi:MAG: FAD-dependent oxidoreductase, partial [Pseudomonadota bacterium]
AQLAVLADWISYGAPTREAVFLTRSRHLRYSGMVPGWISGEHAREAGLVDVTALAKSAGVRVVLDECVALDPEARVATTAGGKDLRFAIASINTGGVGRSAAILGGDNRVIDTRPIDALVEDLGQRFSHGPPPQHVAVVGGGAGGIELAFALANTHLTKTPLRVNIVAGKHGVLPDFGSRARALTKRECARQEIVIYAEDAHLEAGKLFAGDTPLNPDLIIAALGSAAPEWPRIGGLATDDAGFIAVDAHQRSISHPHILASGDVARRTDIRVDPAGVHAVHTGPILAANLRAAAQGLAPSRSYRPRPASLYLLSIGRGEAIASYGSLAAQGRWAALLKAWIDKRWIANYAALSGAA